MRGVNSKFARDPMPEVLIRSHVPRVFFDRCDAGGHALVTNICRCATARRADQFIDDLLRRITKGAAQWPDQLLARRRNPVAPGFRAGLDFFFQDAAADVQTIRANRYTQGSRADQRVADHSLRFLAEGALDDVLHAEIMRLSPSACHLIPCLFGISNRF